MVEKYPRKTRKRRQSRLHVKEQELPEDSYTALETVAERVWNHDQLPNAVYIGLRVALREFESTRTKIPNGQTEPAIPLSVTTDRESYCRYFASFLDQRIKIASTAEQSAPDAFQKAISLRDGFRTITKVLGYQQRQASPAVDK